MLELLVVRRRVGIREEIRNGEVPSHLVIAVNLGIIQLRSKEQVQVEVSELLVHIGDEVVGDVSEMRCVVTHHTFLPNLFDGSVGCDSVGCRLCI